MEMDMRNKRGADVVSGHHLITANIRFKIANIKPNSLIAVGEQIGYKNIRRKAWISEYT